MLTKITIENIALIARAEIELHPKLNILSGETGSGKSVILDSINFVLGAKADKNMIRHGTQQCMVEAVFHLPGDFFVDQFMQELDIEADEDLIISRNFNLDGRGSIKINGHTVNRAMLAKITQLVDVHGQSEHFHLLNEKNQLKLLDTIAGQVLQEKKNSLHALIAEKKSILQKLEKIGGNDEDRMRRLDMLQYQIAEIEEANLNIGEEEKLLEQRKINNNLEKITNALQQSTALLHSDNAIIDSIRKAKRNIVSIASFDERYENIQNRVESLILEAEDIASNLQDYLEELVYDEKEIEKIEERLDCIQKLKRKYGDNEEKILNFYNNAVEEFSLLQNSDFECKELQTKLEEIDEELLHICRDITKIRQEVAKSFCQNVEQELKSLSIVHAQFCTEFISYTKADLQKLTYNGLDEIYFTFSANKGEPLKPLSKVISGGEMSRLMLAIKSNMQDNTQTTTYIFDEIDAGISGITGHIVAEKFAKIANNKQVIAVSHLPQIIAMGDANFKILKIDNITGQTFTKIIPLSLEEKKQEIIRLVGGIGNSISAGQLADELIENSQKYKNYLQKSSSE